MAAAVAPAAAVHLPGLIQADAATNSLIITAPEPLYRNIRAIIDKLDVRRAQVVIESLIVEMTADKAAEFGIQWQALGAVNNTDYGVVASQNFGNPGTNIIGVAGNLTSVGQGLNLGVINGKINIPGVGEVINLAFLARALETTADANILSTPTIQTLDNEEAKFLVGQNIPLITGSYAAAGAGGGVAGVNPFQTFERKDIGLQLRVKPQISEGGVVRLAIYQELSSIQNTLTAAQGGIITNKRSFESTVLVEDGNIVVLGGLIEDRTDNSRSSLPILGRIPGLGYLFSYENRGRKKTNLLVFLRPYVVRDESTSSALALDRYAYIRGQVATNSKSDNLIFKGFQSTQLPEAPPVPPAMRQKAPETTPGGTVPAAPVDPAGLGGRDTKPVPAPQSAAPPASQPMSAPSSPEPRAASAAEPVVAATTSPVPTQSSTSSAATPAVSPVARPAPARERVRGNASRRPCQPPHLPQSRFSRRPPPAVETAPAATAAASTRPPETAPLSQPSAAPSSSRTTVPTEAPAQSLKPSPDRQRRASAAHRRLQPAPAPPRHRHRPRLLRRCPLRALRPRPDPSTRRPDRPPHRAATWCRLPPCHRSAAAANCSGSCARPASTRTGKASRPSPATSFGCGFRSIPPPRAWPTPLRG